MGKTTTTMLAAAMMTAVMLFAAPSAGALAGCGYSAGYRVKVNAYTSCAFARNVARAYSNGYRRPTVYSPTTGRYYRMSCHGGRYSGYCSGGNRAFVSLS